jgi:hypothetical protein
MDEEKIAKHIEINLDGSVTLGKTRYKFINRLFNDEKRLSVNDICLRLIKVVTGKGGAKNNEAFKSLILDLTKALDKEDYSYAVTRIFIAYRLGYKDDINKMYEVAGKEDEITVAPEYVIAKDGFNHPYAIRLGKYL